MIERIKLLRNIGPFDSVCPPSSISFSPLTLIYAENARGKTTLTAIFRSMALDDGNLVMERKRLGAASNPHIVIEQTEGQSIFKDGLWTNTPPEIRIYDDAFVAANICSGMSFDTSHRRNLHELILGARGVELYAELERQIQRIERHNAALREKKAELPETIRGPYTVEEFCDLEKDDDIDTKILDIEQRISGAKSVARLKAAVEFVEMELPGFDTESIGSLLAHSLADISQDAVEQVATHLARLGTGGEEWVANGMSRAALVAESVGHEVCPFCAQELKNSGVFQYFQRYFSESYESLITSIGSAINRVNDNHGGDAHAKFERDLNTLRRSYQFWNEFVDLPGFEVDSSRIATLWAKARDAVLRHLQDKAANPLEKIAISSNTIDEINHYLEARSEFTALVSSLIAVNKQLLRIRAQSTRDNLSDLEKLHARLSAAKTRFNPEVEVLCSSFLDETAAKRTTEQLRERAKESLNHYRTQIFPTYEKAINEYLARFNASFRLGKVRSTDSRGGSSATFCVVINNQEVEPSTQTGPSFRNTLSSGDRNALALSFFFASLMQDSGQANKIVVVDDPMTSLDEHRAWATRKELYSLTTSVQQIIVLSHSKRFLCALWENHDKNVLSAYSISRIRNGSELTTWDIREDSITDHDKRHELVLKYLQSASSTDEREVAQALRLILEAFVRVAYPNHLPAGGVLGPFVNLCKQKLGQSDEILSRSDRAELNELLDYANQFHHDTNPAWKTHTINDTELVDMATRTLLFCSRR